ncbi:MAG: DUF1501 domain-containing protein, partial [Burkholderiaceae bacterium]|nr:DUF1501 domain-containing protein [Burkholderiaceae bacterium]
MTEDRSNLLEKDYNGIVKRSTEARQIFHVSIGGFDQHSGLIAGHGGRMTELAGAMAAFYNATVSLGVADSVTAFTASDFGRTLDSNGEGSDHGWGAHH